MLQRLAMLMSAVGLVMTAACSQTDPGITTAVKSKLAADDRVKAYQIDVDTKDGIVTLTGTVDAAPAREQAIIIARGTDGVNDVVDHIVVAAVPPAMPTTGEIKDELGAVKDAAGNAADAAGGAATDAAITTAVKAKFLADSNTPGMKIDVDTRDGVVTLSGTVRSRAEAENAVAIARESQGVKSVIDNLKIAG